MGFGRGTSVASKQSSTAAATADHRVTPGLAVDAVVRLKDGAL